MGQWLRPLNEAFFQRSASRAESIREHILDLLRTQIGSVRCDPGYGVSVDFVVFNYPTLAEKSDLAKDLRAALLRCDRRLKPNQLSVETRFDDSAEQIDILIEIMVPELAEERCSIRINHRGIHLL